MKNYKLLLMLFAVVILIIVSIFYFKKNDIKLNKNKEQKIQNLSQKSTEEISNTMPNTQEKQVWQGFDKLAFEMSREICKKEYAAISELVDPSVENPQPGTIIPLDQDSKSVLNVSQVVEWLKKTANSKCASFRKNNAEQFFNQFTINENNYTLFYSDFENILKEYQGFTPYRLIRKSLQTLDKASAQEKESLKSALRAYFNNYIDNISSPIDVFSILLSLKEMKEKELIRAPSGEQIEEMTKKFEKENSLYKQQNQKNFRDYIPAGTDFGTLTQEKMAELFGYEGTKAQWENERNGYEMVRRFAQKIRSMIDKEI